MTTPTAEATVPLRVVDLGQRFFGSPWILRGCSFELRPGSVTALIGPNGAGKSTLMQAIVGLQRPREGSIDIEGDTVATPSRSSTPAHPNLGYLAQDKPLYKNYRVRDMVAIAQHLNIWWDQQHADELIDAAGLDRSQKVRTLSGGQRTRLAVALVLARRPNVLLLDEPLADLDPLARLEVSQTLMTEVADTGMTVLLSSHILGEVADLCEDVLVMGSPDGGGGGRITLSGEIDDILDNHRVLTGPGTSDDDLDFLPTGCIVEQQHAARQTTVLVNQRVSRLPEGWTTETPTLDEIVVAYLRSGRARGDQDGQWGTSGATGVSS